MKTLNFALYDFFENKVIRNSNSADELLTIAKTSINNGESYYIYEVEGENKKRELYHIYRTDDVKVEKSNSTNNVEIKNKAVHDMYYQGEGLYGIKRANGEDAYNNYKEALRYILGNELYKEVCRELEKNQRIFTFK